MKILVYMAISSLTIVRVLWPNYALIEAIEETLGK